MWQETYESQESKTPKSEWAYISFVQASSRTHPHALRTKIVAEWKKEREAHVKKVYTLLQEVL